MARDISVSIAVQGEKEFNQALRDAQSAVKVLSSELKASEAAFDESADAQAFYANKTRLINAQIEQQKAIMQALEQAVREAGEEFGDASSKTDKYRIEINRTEASIAKLERSLRETQQEAEELGRDSTRIGRQLEDGIGDAAKDTGDQLEMLDKRLEGIDASLAGIGKNTKISALIDAGKAAFEAAGVVADAVNSITSETEDYRRQMSFMEQNALNFGFDPEEIKQKLFEIASITGDMDGAFEGISNLMATGFDGKELAEAIDLINGAVIRFPETMKFENLAESLQETVATGSVAGAYAELVERLGGNLEDVNTALSNATTAEEKQQIALAYLNEHGLEDTVQNYKDMNTDLIEAERSQLLYNDALAGLGETLTPLGTSFTNFKTSVVQGITDLMQSEGMTLWTDALTSAFDNVSEYLNGEEWQQALSNISDAFVFVYNSIATAKSKIDELWADYLKGEEEAEARISELNESENPYREMVEQIDQKIRELYEAGHHIEAQELSRLRLEADNIAAEYAFGGIDEAAYQEQLAAIGEAAGLGLSSGLVSGLQAGEEENAASIETSGLNAAISFNNGIVEGSADAISSASSLWSSVNSILSQEIVIPAPRMEGTGSTAGRLGASSYATGSAGNKVTVITQLDGERVAEATANGIDGRLGSQAQRDAVYG